LWAGIDRVTQLLAEGVLVIHREACPNLVSDLGSYRRKQVRGIMTDEIENKNDAHMADCVRYLAAWWLGAEDQEETVIDYRPQRFLRFGG